VKGMPMKKYLEIGNATGSVKVVAAQFGVSVGTVYQARKVAEWKRKQEKLSGRI
jgi:predicted transcriptional regulator